MNAENRTHRRPSPARRLLAPLRSLGHLAGSRPALFRMAAASVVTLATVLTLLTGTGTAAYATGGENACSGSSSSSSDPHCPAANNDDLLPQREMPANVYRGDDRSPDDIFRNGFMSRGTNYDLQHHVAGRNAQDSGFISTTGTRSMAEYFAEGAAQAQLGMLAARTDCESGWYQLWIWIPGLGRYLQNQCQGRTVTTHAYVYEVDTALANNALYVPDQLRNLPRFRYMLQQDEWAYERWIPTYAIRGVRVYTATATVNGQFVNRPTLTFDRFIPSPNYRRPVRLYDPTQDPDAHFTVQTNLNVPPQPANPYNRGCSAADQCRDGNG